MKRRDFLKNVTTLVVVPAIVNKISAKSFDPLQALTAIANADNTDRVLVLIQLKGGNDGLNMVIPINQYDAYYNARSNIAINKSAILSLSAYPDTGLHPAMTGIQEKFNADKVKIIQSVSYPNPNFSHFRATDIWMSASDPNQVISTGWDGRYLDSGYPNFPTGYPNAQMPDPLAIEIGSTLSLVFQGAQMNLSFSVSDPTNFYNLINGIQDTVPNTPAGKELAFIRTTASQSNAYGAVIKNAANNVLVQSSSYPTQGTNSLADQLKIVARLIAGGLKTKIYMVNLGSFDTHNSQVNTTNTSIGTHANLLGKLSDAISAFMTDLDYLNISNRVLGMTFSEFGRRIKSNSSNGTDHGVAAPMFVFGNSVVPGILGSNPNIPASATVNDNVAMQYDFRSIYASILEQWFGVNSTLVDTLMLKSFQRLPIVKTVGTAINYVHDDKSLLSNYPNPFSDFTTIKFETQGEHILIEIYDIEGHKLNTLVDREYESGIYTVTFTASSLPAGIYYARLQNKTIQQTLTLIKK